jgi:hypothetical protein
MLKDSCEKCVPAKLCPMSFGAALGITNALGLFVLGILAMYWGIGLPMVSGISSVYHGFAPTWIGSIYGALWGLLDGFIFGVVAALIYDCSVCCCRCCRKKVVEDVVVVRKDRR